MASETGAAAWQERPPEVPGYRLLRRIGAGAYGDVWLAEDKDRDHVAIKLIDRERLRLLSRTNREERALQLLQSQLPEHEHLIEVYDAGETDRYLYYAMNLADDASGDRGEELDIRRYQPKTLADLVLRGRAIPIEEAIGIIRNLLGAVGCLHKHGIVHRDIKPTNILSVQGRWTLADIGLMAEDATFITTVGSPDFMPPTGRIDRTVDFYALGKILYCLVTGSPPRSFPRIPVAMLTNQERVWAASEVNEVIGRACAAAPDNRFQSDAEFQAALEACVQRIRDGIPNDADGAFVASGSVVLGADQRAAWGKEEARRTALPRVERPRTWLESVTRKVQIAIALWLLPVVVLAGAWMMFFPLYSVSAYVRVIPRSVTPLHDSSSGGTLEEFDRLRNTLAAMVAASNLLMDVLHLPEIKETKFYSGHGGDFERALYDLERRLRVRVVPDSALIEVTMLTKEPMEARLIVNTIINRFVQRDVSRFNDDIAIKLKVLRQSEAQAQARYKATNDLLRQMRMRSDVPLNADTIKAQAAFLFDLEAEWKQFERQLIQVDELLKAEATTTSPSDYVGDLEARRAMLSTDLAAIFDQLAKARGDYRQSVSEVGEFERLEEEIRAQYDLLSSVRQKLMEREADFRTLEEEGRVSAMLATRDGMWPEFGLMRWPVWLTAALGWLGFLWVVRRITPIFVGV